MIRWTTPSLKCSIPQGVDFNYILLTLIQGNTIIEKRIESNEVVDNSFTVFFNQEETGQLMVGMKVKVQLNLMYGNTRIATNIVELQATENLHNEIIEVL